MYRHVLVRSHPLSIAEITDPLESENHIFGFDELVLTINKMLKVAKVIIIISILYCFA